MVVCTVPFLLLTQEWHGLLFSWECIIILCENIKASGSQKRSGLWEYQSVLLSWTTIGQFRISPRSTVAVTCTRWISWQKTRHRCSPPGLDFSRMFQMHSFGEGILPVCLWLASLNNGTTVRGQSLWATLESNLNDGYGGLKLRQFDDKLRSLWMLVSKFMKGTELCTLTVCILLTHQIRCSLVKAEFI